MALVKGTMKLMTWIKLKLMVGVGVGVILAGGVITIALMMMDSKGPTPLLCTGTLKAVQLSSQCSHLTLRYYHDLLWREEKP
jgi:hypothetical protein